jgi:hypothetical protein
MINVKISLPNEDSYSSFENFIDPRNKLLKNIRFHINNDVSEADFWFVFEDLYKQQEKCLVDRKRVVYLNTETSYPNSYFLNEHIKKYINQFNLQYGCYETFVDNHFSAPPFLPWMIDYKSNTSIFSQNGKSVEDLMDLKSLKKTKSMSVICSNKQQTENHKMRYEFTKKLKDYFGDELDWYGNGVMPVEDKWEGIKDYKYHIVIENGQKNNLISEKLLDSYLGLSFPIYYGAPNISDYFPNKSLVKIDLNNFKETVKIIENVINNNTYENNIENIYSARNLVLGKHNFLNRISKIIETIGYEKEESSREMVVLNNVQSFWNDNTSLKRKAKHIISRKLRLNN